MLRRDAVPPGHPSAALVIVEMADRDGDGRLRTHSASSMPDRGTAVATLSAMSYPPPGGQPPQPPSGNQPGPQPPGQPPYGAPRAPDHYPTAAGYPPPGPGYPQPGPPGPAPNPRRRPGWLLPPILGAILLLVAGAAVTAIMLTRSSGTPVANLDEGDCLVSSDLAAGNGSVGEIEVGDCDQAHDAEVFATFELEDEDAEEYDDAAPARCASLLADHDSSLDALAEDDLEVRPLTQDEEPAAGDDVACLARHKEGDELDQPVFD